MVKKAAQATPNLLLRAAFNNALAVIQSYSLLRRSSHQQTLSMHRVVQAVLADAMTNQEHDQWTDRAIAALNALFPEVRHQAWGQWGQCGASCHLSSLWRPPLPRSSTILNWPPY